MLWLHIARHLYTLLCECVAMPETSFITKEWENSRTAPHYTMHFVVLSHEQGRGINLWIQPWFSWFHTTATFRGIIPCFFPPRRTQKNQTKFRLSVCGSGYSVREHNNFQRILLIQRKLFEYHQYIKHICLILNFPNDILILILILINIWQFVSIIKCRRELTINNKKID